MSAADIARALGGGRRNGRGFRCRCPAHDDQGPSLDVEDGKTALIFKCRAGCSQKDVLAAEKIMGRPLFDKPREAVQSRSNGEARVEPRPKTIRTICYDYRDPASGEVRYRKTRREYADGTKTFFIDTKGRGGSAPLLYGAERLANLAEGQAVWIVEGEKKVDRLRELGAIAVSGDTGAQSRWLPEHAGLLRGLPMIFWPDSDAQGEQYIANAAAAIRAVEPSADIRVVRPFGPPDGAKGRDVCDWVGDAAGIEELAAGALPYGAPLAPGGGQPSLDETQEIARLAKLKSVDYERERKSSASKLGIRASILDRVVAAARPREETAGQGRPLDLPETEPWPEAVDGAVLLSELAAAIRRHVVLDAKEADAIALWSLHTHCFGAFLITPRLAIMSPEKRCGKTTLLDVIALLVARALPTVDVSPPCLFRAVEMARPSLLIDEADNAFGKAGQAGQGDDLRRILNSGHRRGGHALRSVGDDHEPRVFSTFAPAAIALIGRLPDTLADRSVVVSLKRRLPSEKIARFRADRVDDLAALARKAARWAADHASALGEADPVLPDTLYNRDADNWRPLFAIAEIAGGPWPGRVKTAALGQVAASDDDSLKAELLADIRDAFAGKE